MKYVTCALAVLVVLCLLLTAVCLAGGAYVFYTQFLTPKATEVMRPVTTLTPFVYRTPTPYSGLPTITPFGRTPGVNPTPAPTWTPSSPRPGVDLSGAQQTLKVLENAAVPVNDPRDLALRLKNIPNIPETMPLSDLKEYKIGDARKFWVTNSDTNANFQVDATLRYVSPHLYFWVQNDVSYREADLKKLGDTFEDKIYPTTRKFFGSEWSPGVDNDVHLYILYVKGVGSHVAGYFSSSDEIHPLAHPYSNAAELFVVNAENTRLTDTYTYGVLAHEFQHMIHWYRDRNEDTWLNEGFAELSAFLNDFGGDDKASLAMSRPDMQLTDWPNDPNATSPYYGSAFLFVNYFLGRFGEQATQAVVSHAQNGLESIDLVLKDLKLTNPKTGKPLAADDVFQDWTLANYIQDKSVDNGLYSFPLMKRTYKAATTETISRCPYNQVSRTVSQYGTDYVRITCQGSFNLRFEGSQTTKVLPQDAHSGKYMFWSNKGDESDMTLTQTFDFTSLQAPIKLSYWTWYDLEEDYDYLYLAASLDGSNWEIIRTPSSTDKNPSGNSYGWGYNGKSRNWIKEEVDLSKFAGKKVTLRFEYVTDAAVNGEGLLLDDMELAALNYKTDFESDDGGWEARGFVRIQNLLPQTFRLSVVSKGRTTTVETITLAADQTTEIPIKIEGGVSEVTLVVSGTTRFTRTPASYRFSIGP